MQRFIALFLGILASLFLLASCGGGGSTVKSDQPTVSAPTRPSAKPEPPKIKGREAFPQLAWLVGCWKAEVNDQAYYEHWLPERNGVIFGITYTVVNRKSANHQLVRLEVTGDVLELIVTQSGKKEQHFVYVSGQSPLPNGGIPELADFAFQNVEVDVFPKWVSYRRETGEFGFLTVSGMIGGEQRESVFPLQKVNCATREVSE
ncbi:MAG: DUF6265 family protein [Burkholderiales bacterium]|jgi:hypothetical protein|nr:DUF6265 family protein [Burkholderiales bacterium]